MTVPDILHFSHSYVSDPHVSIACMSIPYLSLQKCFIASFGKLFEPTNLGTQHSGQSVVQLLCLSLTWLRENGSRAAFVLVAAGTDAFEDSTIYTFGEECKEICEEFTSAR